MEVVPKGAPTKRLRGFLEKVTGVVVIAVFVDTRFVLVPFT